MGGYASPLTGSDNLEEIPGTGIGEEDSLLGKIRRFSALSAMEDPEEAPADSRVDDERHGASGGPAGPDATAASINPSAAAPAAAPAAAIQPGAAAQPGYQDDPQEKGHLADLIAQRQALLNPAPKPSLKHRILASIVQAAPTAIGAMAGGMPAAAGAAKGSEDEILRQRQDQTRREGVRTQQAATLGQQAEQVQGRMDTQRAAAGAQQRGFTNTQVLSDKITDRQKQIEDERESNRSALAAENRAHQDDRDDKRFKETEAGLDKRLADSDKRQQAGFENSNALQDKRLAAQVAMYDKKEKDKEGELTTAAQGIIMGTEPVKDQIDRIMDTLEPVKSDNTPFSSTVGRLKYKIGIGASDEDNKAGDLAKQMGELSLMRIAGAARVLKGSSRAYQIFEDAQQHLPDPWKDSKSLMYQKLTTLRQNLTDIEDDARKFGNKSGKTPPTSGPRSPGAPGAASTAIGKGSPAAGDFGLANGFPEGHTGKTQSGKPLVVKGGRWVLRTQ